MTKHLRTVKTSLIMGILFFSAIAALSTPASAREYIVTFNSFITLAYESEDLNQPIDINKAVTVPLEIGYYTDVQIPNFLMLLPFTLRNTMIYGSPMPQQSVHLKVLNSPDWANIYFSTPDHDVDIPGKDEEPFKIQVNLIISPLREAPSEPFNIEFSIEVEKRGRVMGKTMNYNVNFQPAYVPEIGVTVDRPSRMVGPREEVNVNIKIKNNANYWTIVRHEMIDVPDDWSPIINPTKIEISPGGEETITLSVTPPYNFGWHDETKVIQIDFTPEASPGGGEPGPSVQVYLRFNNRGFSTPGFETAFLFIAISLFMILFAKRRKITK